MTSLLIPAVASLLLSRVIDGKGTLTSCGTPLLQQNALSCQVVDSSSVAQLSTLHAGILLATYWAARYFTPAVISIWLAKQARKHWDLASAVVVMAASYAASMAVSYHLLAGPTSIVRLHYPLFSGNVTIPMIVAKWIRHNKDLAKVLTKTVSGHWLSSVPHLHDVVQILLHVAESLRLHACLLATPFLQ